MGTSADVDIYIKKRMNLAAYAAHFNRIHYSLFKKMHQSQRDLAQERFQNQWSLLDETDRKL